MTRHATTVRTQRGAVSRLLKHMHGPTPVLAVVALLIGCTGPQPRPADRVPAPALPVLCSPVCLVPCADALPRWQGDPDSPATWDALGELVGVLRARIDACEQARAACVQCLRRLDEIGATCGTAIRCEDPA